MITPVNFQTPSGNGCYQIHKAVSGEFFQLVNRRVVRMTRPRSFHEDVDIVPPWNDLEDSEPRVPVAKLTDFLSESTTRPAMFLASDRTGRPLSQ